MRRATASFTERILDLTFTGAAVASTAASVASPAVGAASAARAVAAQDRAEIAREARRTEAHEQEQGTVRRTKAIFAAATLLLMISGLLVEQFAGRGFSSSALFVGAYFFGGYFGVLAGIESLKGRRIDVDILMVLAALGAAIVGAPFEGALLLFLFSLSNVLQDLAISRTRKAIKSLMKLRPSEALCRRGGELRKILIDELEIGDTVLIRPGEAIALDSVIVEGESSLDESSLTGESMPVTKKPGDPVFAGTINQTGGLEVRVSKLARDSTIAKLIRMVEEAQAEKADTQRFLEKTEQIYATGVVLLTVGLVLVPWLLLGQSFHDVFYRAMTVMVVASPCALIISTPASILSAIGGAARRGVLFKGGVYLEQLARIEIIAFDKTGTLTIGKPRVTDVVPVAETPFSISSERPPHEADKELLKLAASVEARSEHPLAKAIVSHAKAQNLVLEDCRGFRSYTGQGVQGYVANRSIIVGSPDMFEQSPGNDDENLSSQLSRLHDEGKTVMLVGEIQENDQIDHGKVLGEGGVQVSSCRQLGLIAVADTLRPEAPEVTRNLKSLGIRKLVMLTGDHGRVARAIARQVGVDEVHADLLPEDKVKVVRFLKNDGRVAMVGDGINDAPALATANVGIAMGAAGTDVAMETADIVLMSDNLKNIPFALRLSRRSQTIIFENLGFALVVIVVLVASALGFHLPLPAGVVGHEGSTVLVCLNGLRLLAFRG